MTINVAQVGCGYWGRNLARNFRELGALAAICDPNPETARQQAEANGVVARSLEDVLADKSIEAVSIAAPAEMHLDLSLQAFAAGKHVFVEKPIALSVEEGERMKAAANKAGCVLMVGHLLQYHPAFIALLDQVRSGALGDLRYAYSHRLSLGKFRVEENALWSFAPHDVSMLLALFGEEPETVSGKGGAYVTPGIEDECRLDLTFAGGRRAHVFASWLHPFKEHRLVVVGEKAMAVFEDSAQGADKLRLYKHTIDTSGHTPAPTKADAEPIPYGTDEPLRSECSHFLDCCAGKTSARTDADEALRVLKVLVKASEN